MKVITGPLIEPVSLAEVKEQLGIDHDLSDGLIARRIKEAREWAEPYTGRAFITQTREKRWDCFVDEHECPSALTVVSVKYLDSDGALQTLASDQYELDTYSFIPFVQAADDVTWPSTRSKRNAVRIQYTAGYGATPDTVPALIKEALILTVGHWMHAQGRIETGLTSPLLGVARIPFAVRDMLDQFKLDFL